MVWPASLTNARVDTLQTSDARLRAYKAIVQANPPNLDFIYCVTQVGNSKRTQLDVYQNSLPGLVLFMGSK